MYKISFKVHRQFRPVAVMLLGLLSWQHGFALSIDEARHLLTRSGFGAAPLEIAALLPMTRDAAVDHVLKDLEPVELVPLDGADVGSFGELRHELD